MTPNPASALRFAIVFTTVLTTGLTLFASSGVSVAADAFLSLRAATPGAFNYARLSDIQVFLDASPTRCSVLLTDGLEIKAFQKCASITEHLEQIGLVTFPNAFGSVLLAPSFVSSLIATNNGGCRLNLRNGRWVPVSLSCDAVHDKLSHP
ncbi:hypothetical protein MPC4_30193 [Methylocella tundrae]|jgi:hypothetical protein|uniref:Uncharacterized protein n=1 Tax=Methylocella tundrae TaxID=227605 RepID=A0A8B6M7K6_METTU|nr:hypothetical protein [Methylocella tundrae]VTZ26772.1 hypothetical protein MPC1_3840002 [Methylocella tundrae]VTZ51009.1 hypothetical protein MPC4_30193 [Methylocella tundrae]